VRLGLVSDLHMTTDPAASASWHNQYDFAGLPGRIDAARDAFRRAGVDAAIACGDITHAGDEESIGAALERLSSGLGRPVFVVAGNHDLLERPDQLARCLPGGCHMLAAGPVDASEVHLSGVPIERDDQTRGFLWTGACGLWDGAHPKVIASHFPVISRADRLRELGLRYPRGLANRADLFERVAGGGPAVVLSGHIHARESHAESNVLQLSAGALVEAPYEVAIVDVRVARRRIRVRRRTEALGPAPAGPNPVLAPPDETWTFAKGSWRRGRTCRRG
jgi:predicted phosphodiesterase